MKKYVSKFEEKNLLQEMALICQEKGLRIEVRSKEAGNEPYFCLIINNQEVNISILRAEYVHPNNPKYKLDKREKRLLDFLLRRPNKKQLLLTNFEVIKLSWDIINYKYTIKKKNVVQPDYRDLDS